MPVKSAKRHRKEGGGGETWGKRYTISKKGCDKNQVLLERIKKKVRATGSLRIGSVRSDRLLTGGVKRRQISGS